MSSVNELLISLGLKDWEMFYDYLSAYGVHITLCTILSAVTVYRREISCNRSYRKEEDEDEGTGSNNNNNNNNNNNKNNNNNLADNNNGNDNSMTLFNDDDDDDDEEKELMTEQLLDGAGMYYSGKPILNFAALLWLGLECYDYSENDENNNDNGNGNAENEKEESSSSSSSSTTTSLMNDLTPEDLLDRVGNYASPPEAIMATIALFMLWKKSKLSSSSSSSSSSPSSFRNYKNIGCDPFMKGIPPDVHVQIASFLHPRDVVTLSCVSKAYHTITDETNNTTSVAIWKTLWHRDYSWIVYQWTIGKQALLRSNCTQWSYSKDFYFLFGQSYLDYVIAGHNTLTNCLVGIHSNIYDITPFLFSHPGSPDTLMVHSGRDATRFFDDMGHSTGARRIAMSMCVVVDRSAQNDNNNCGLFPTSHTVVVDDDDVDDKNNNVAKNDNHRLPPRLVDGEDNLLAVRRRTLPPPRTTNNNNNNSNNINNNNNVVNNGRGGTLFRIKTCFIIEREQVRRRMHNKYSNDPTILGHEVNVYKDPFTRKWNIWYTDTDLQTVYLPAS